MKNYYNFKYLGSGQMLLTNDLGYSLILMSDEFRRFVRDDFTSEDPLYQKLHERYFILEPMEIFSDEIPAQIRQIKSYTFSPTVLHIFVVTTSCNLKCVYCQAQSECNEQRKMMSIETARRSVDLALQSPAKELTFEFQGGEPLLNFPAIKEIIAYTNQNKGNKEIQFTLVSNLSLLTQDMAEYLLENNVSICTSIDGPAELHNQNRPSPKAGVSYAMTLAGKRLLHEKGCQTVGAIQTTTRHSLPYAREIVQEYRRIGLNGIFLRPLTPLGFANAHWREIGYSAEEWLKFYRDAFDEILQINRNGYFFVEQHASIFLKKILQSYSENYMELRSPCGAGIGQLAYYCDGNIYTCDEARMISETGDQSFCLGNVFADTYQSIMESSICKSVCSASILESISDCCDCVYQPYCGVCPVVNYASSGDLFPREPNGYRCLIYKGILDHLFSLLCNNDKETICILNSWVGGD